jgi:predicted GTPase
VKGYFDLGYTINIIDTPGFGDTRGLDYDKQIVDQIRELFSSKGAKGMTTIDAVCFILKAPDSSIKPNY